jgi:hypothetical protein
MDTLGESISPSPRAPVRESARAVFSVGDAPLGNRVSAPQAQKSRHEFEILPRRRACIGVYIAHAVGELGSFGKELRTLDHKDKTPRS